MWRNVWRERYPDEFLRFGTVICRFPPSSSGESEEVEEGVGEGGCGRGGTSLPSSLKAVPRVVIFRTMPRLSGYRVAAEGGAGDDAVFLVPI